MSLVKIIKKVMNKTLPAYRVSLRAEEKTVQLNHKIEMLFWYGINRDGETLTETKQRFFSSIPLADGNLRKAQLVVLDILREFDKVCKENDILYWVMGGSLVGAIRHKGFIPWDDDVDVGMTRKDLQKFKEKSMANNKIKLINYYNFNGKYRIPKVVLKDTETDFCIDVVVFDEVEISDGSNKSKIWTRNRKLRKKVINKLRVIRRIWFRDFTHTQTLENDLGRKEKLDSFFDRAVKKCNYDTSGNTLIWGIDNFDSKAKRKMRIFNKDDIFPCNILQFENLDVPVPKQYRRFSMEEVGDCYAIPLDIGYCNHFSEKKMERQLKKIEELYGRR